MLSKSDLIERLISLDERASLEFENFDGKFQCAIVGGSALILMNYLSRATHDIDIINVVEEKLRNLFEFYDFNCNARTHLFSFPDDWRGRAKPVEIKTTKIDYFTLSLEDLVVSKLNSNRQQDKQDIRHPNILKSLDWDLLESLVIEVKDGLLNERNQNDFAYNYHEYVKECKK